MTVTYYIIMLKHISIQLRIAIGFGIIICSFVIFALYSLDKLKELSQDTNLLFEKPIPAANKSLDALQAAIEIRRNMKILQISDDYLEIENTIQLISDNEKIILEALDFISTKIKDKKAKNIERQIRRSVLQWQDIKKGIINMIYEGNKQIAIDVIENKGSAILKNIEKYTREMRYYSIENATSYQTSVQNVMLKIQNAFIHITLIVVILSIIISIIVLKSISDQLKRIYLFASNISKGNFKTTKFIDIKSNDQIGKLAKSLNEMKISLQKAYRENEKQNWIKNGQNKFYEKIRGIQNEDKLAQIIINFTTNYIEGQAGAFYRYEPKKQELILSRCYAYPIEDLNEHNLIMGSGYVGQAGLEKKQILIRNVPENYMKIKSALGQMKPKNIIAIPLLFEDELYGVIEILTMKYIENKHIEFLQNIAESIAIAIVSVRKIENIIVHLQK